MRYAFAGLAFGAILPLFSYSYEAMLIGGPALRARMGEPVHVLMAIVPLFLAFVFFRFGQDKARFTIELRMRARRERRLIELSLRDRLTGLPNRLALEREFARLASLGNGGAARPALLLLDLNRFKIVNDTLGHAAGDELLGQMANRLRRTLPAPIGLFRYGGDEFVVTVPHVPDRATLARLCEAISEAAGAPFALSMGEVLSGVAIGVSRIEPEDGMLAAPLNRADIALYRAKRAGNPSYAFWEASDQAEPVYPADGWAVPAPAALSA